MATELAKAYVQIVPSADGISSGIESAFNGTDVSNVTTKAGNSIGSTFAKTASAAIVAGATTVAAAAGTFWSGLNQVASVGDEIDKTSQKIGASAEQYQVLAFAAEHCGFSTSVLTTASKTLSQTDFDGNIWDALDAVMALDDANERAALSEELFGAKATQQMAALLNGTESLDDYKNSLSELGGILSDEAVSGAAGFEDSLTNLKIAMSGTKNSMMAEFLPGVTSVMDGLTGIFSGDEGAISMIADGLTDITTKFSELIPSIVDGIVDLLPTLLDAAVMIIEALAQGLIDSLPELMPSVVNIILSLCNKIIELLPEILKVGMEVLLELATGIANALPDLIPTIVDVVLTIVETLIDNIDALIDAAIEIILALADGLIEALPKLIEKIPEIIIKLVDALCRNAPKLVEASITLIKTLAEGLIKNLPTLIKQIPSMVLNILKSFGDGFKAISQIGADLIAGLWNGIGDKVSWITEKIKGFASDVLSSIKGFFGIGSPSKVMRDEVGKWLPEGIAVGIDTNLESVEDAMDNLGTTMLNPFDLGTATATYELTGSNESVAKMDQMIEKMESYISALANMRIVLDSGVLVGETAPKMDAALGALALKNQRGVYV